MWMVECITLDGRKKKVRNDRLVLRPAVYAVMVHHGKVLLVKLRHTGKYHLPGGGIGIGERIEDALRREIREETGIEVDIGELAHFEELFFYYDPSQTAYHGLYFYYLCRPKTIELLDDSQVDDDVAEQPRWVSIEGLRSQDFQVHGEIVLELCRKVDHQP